MENYTTDIKKAVRTALEKAESGVHISELPKGSGTQCVSFLDGTKQIAFALALINEDRKGFRAFNAECQEQHNLDHCTSAVLIPNRITSASPEESAVVISVKKISQDAGFIEFELQEV